MFLPSRRRCETFGFPHEKQPIGKLEQVYDRKLFLDEKFLAECFKSGTDNLYAEAIAERQLLRQVLAHTAGNQLRAAALLGISGVTLRSKKKLSVSK